MCGFIGFWSDSEKSEKLLNDSLALLQHRGPDAAVFDQYGLKKGFLGLGHVRLSIIDTSEHANQPFHSACGRYSLIFNGEVYNYKELREELVNKGYKFLTDSDTEVLLYALVEQGVSILKRIVGMFSFVFYNREEEQLLLARDAFGIKPFFYSLADGELYFSSDLRSLLHLRQIPVKPNLQRAYDYLVHGDYDSNEESFVEGVKHLSQASYFTYCLKTSSASAIKKWWQPDIQTNSQITFDTAKQQVKHLFLQSVKLHLRSDVPLGIALSGGIDSSAVVSAVRHIETSIPIKTFSFIASDARISEEKWIDALSGAMNTQSYKVRANQEEMQKHLQDMLLKQGEPFGGTSIYAQYRVFKLAKEQGVTVTLDGQGADELLAGYSGYPGHRLLSIIESDGFWAAHKYVKRWMQAPGRSYTLAWLYLARILLPNNLYAWVRKKMGRDFTPAWLNTSVLKQAGVDFNEHRSHLSKENKGIRVKEALASSLTHRGLASLLRHGDRNSMAFSIESRVPFLSLPLAEFLLSLPENYLVSDDGTTKHIFREAMRGIVPDEILDRKDKIGFATPEHQWLMSMTDVIEQWIAEAPEIEFINKNAIQQEFDQVKQGKRPFDGRVWRWVNYLRWYQLMIIGNNENNQSSFK